MRSLRLTLSLLAGVAALTGAASGQVLPQLVNNFQNEFSTGRQAAATTGTTITVTGTQTNTVAPPASTPLYKAVVSISGANNTTASLVLSRSNRAAGDLVELSLTWTGASANPTVTIYDNATTGTVLENFPAPGILGGSRNDFFLYNGTSWAVVPWPPVPSTGDPLFTTTTGRQFQGNTAYDGWQARSTAQFVQPSGSSPTLIYPATPNYPGQASSQTPAGTAVQMQSAVIGRPLVLAQASFGFGAVVPPPTTNAQGAPTPYNAEPVHSLLTSVTTNVTNTAGVTTTTSSTSLAAVGATIGTSTNSTTDASGNTTVVITTTGYGNPTTLTAAATGSTSGSSTTLTLTAGVSTNINGYTVTGAGIAAGTTISGWVNSSTTSLTMSQANTVSSGTPLTFTLTTGYAFDPFYWSVNAQQVYATQPGVITITWQAQGTTGTAGRQTVTYVISSSPAKTPKQMYWTENGFNGPHVSVPTGKVNAVNVIYNPAVPQYVTQQAAYRQPNQPLYTLVQTQTFWYDSQQGIFSAYNREGYVFVEYLGGLTNSGASRQQLDTEIIQVSKEVSPLVESVEIGDVIPPPPDPVSGEVLTPAIVAGEGLAGPAFVYEAQNANSTETLYAVRQTTPQANPADLSNEVLIYWEAPDAIGVAWPKYYAGYTMTWPTIPGEISKYTVYARPDCLLYPAESLATGVQLQSTDTPALQYQDDPANIQAQITPQDIFYSNCSAANPTNRALIRYTNGNLTWFQRIYSEVDSSFANYQGTYSDPLSINLPAPGGSQDAVFLPAGTGYLTASGGYNVTVSDPTGNVYQPGVNYTIGTTSGGVSYLSPFYSGLSRDLTFDASSGLGANGAVLCLAAQPTDSRIIVGGSFTQFNGATAGDLVRLNTDGSVDSSFLGGTLTGANGAVRAVAVDSQGRVLIGGDFTQVDGVAQNHVARLLSNGQLDTTFQASSAGPNQTVRAIAVDSSNNVLIGGDFTTVNGIAAASVARLTAASGALDTTFAASANNSVYALAVQSNGSVLVAGAFTQLNSTTSGHVARVTALGALDATFLNGLAGADNTVYAIGLESNGEVVIGGAFANVNATTMSRVAMLTASGALDPNFLASPLTGVTGTAVSALAIQNDGKILIGGTFTAVNGTAMTNLARLTTAGGLDTFNQGSAGANAAVDAIVVEIDSSVILGGPFTAVDGVVANDIARFLPNTPLLPSNVTITFNSVPAQAVVGARILPPNGDPADTYASGSNNVYVGYIHQDSSTLYDPQAYVDPFVNGFDAAALGAIIPVNAHYDQNGNPTDQLEVWWYTQVASQASGSGTTYWPSIVQNYALVWPTYAPQIVLASNAGSGQLNSLQAGGSIYYQNDKTQPGYNPNEEHAMMLGGTAYALRDDLNVPDGHGLGHYSTSDPFVLVAYTEADGRPAMAVFQVLRTTAQYPFSYTATAGTPLQSPMPLPLLPPPYTAAGAPADYEDGAIIDPPAVNVNATDGSAGYFNHYNYFTFTDRFGSLWVYRGPHNGGTPSFNMHYFYYTQPGFFYPTLPLGSQPAVGTLTPYLRQPVGSNGYQNGYQGDPVTGLVSGQTTVVPEPITFVPSWPANPPVLPIGQSLTVATMGLTAVRGQDSAQVLYQQSIALDTTHSSPFQAVPSVFLYDPTVAKVYPFSASGNTSSLSVFPASLNTSAYQGKTYFPDLPPHLSQRLYFDPTIGANGSLVLLGQFVDDPTGEKYILPNILSGPDQAAAYALVSTTDQTVGGSYADWTAAIDGLSVSVSTYAPDPQKGGAFTIETGSVPLNNFPELNIASTVTTGIGSYLPPITPQTYYAAGYRNFTYNPTGSPGGTAQSQIAQVYYRDTAVDSYALSAAGGGTGYVVMAFGNGQDTNLTPAADPVQLSVFQVAAPLYTGQLKVITPQNPLDEKVILQHTGDFAGHPEYYDFEWRYTPSPSNGTLPTLYSYQGSTVVGDSVASQSTTLWRLISDPVSSTAVTGFRLPSADPSTLQNVIITNGGSNYSNATTVTFSGGGATLPAQGAPLVVGGVVTGVIITSAGTGYTTPPTVIFTDASGSGATATAMVSQLYILAGSIVVNDGFGTPDNGTTLPNAVLRRTFSTPATVPAQLYLSLSLGTYDSAQVFVNGASVAAYNVPATAFDYALNTNQVVTPAATPPLSPLPLVFQVPTGVLAAVGGTNVLTVELYSTADVGAQDTVDVRLEGVTSAVNLASWVSLPPISSAPYDDTVGAVYDDGITTSRGKNRYLVQGASILTLSDNYYIMRYRANSNNPNYGSLQAAGWSSWTSPALVEGWINRALAGINPFSQRVTDLYDNSVSTGVSLIEQAGTPYEGNIALNLSNINSVGLISIYETILNKGESLSIDGAPPINYAGANQALLMAAGNLSDLYTILGNAAEADSENPTIAYSSTATPDFTTLYGSVATSLFSFQGEVASLLDEQLALLRGRDDTLAPGVTTFPVFNRLYWNYTNGIAAGEAVYALNYDITDVNGDGFVNAEDAAIMFPMGHGDAYGHFLTAITEYYGLLASPNFSWIPEIETVDVLGVPVAVNYQDERKFAQDALAVARTGAETLSLTFRSAYNPTSTGWSQYIDGTRSSYTFNAGSGASSGGETGTPNSNTGITRHWGFDDWACRAGQGAYLNWVVANSLLPAVDPNPLDTGIQKVDRTTVPELPEIVTEAAAIQQTLDNADTQLNPLGLANSALSFDISPTEIDAGETHYEQIYGRAVQALQNASDAFANASSATQFLRQQNDSLANQVDTINDSEQTFTNQLIGIYGTPYSDDIGPTGTYVQGYTGPDLYHYAYVDIPPIYQTGVLAITGSARTINVSVIPPSSIDGLAAGSPEEAQVVSLTGVNLSDPNNVVLNNLQSNGTGVVGITINSDGVFLKPASWTGSRASTGQIQSAIESMITTNENLYQAVIDYQTAQTQLGEQVVAYNTAVTERLSSLSQTSDYQTKYAALQLAVVSLKAVGTLVQNGVGTTNAILQGIRDALPTSVGLATDPSGPARTSIDTSVLANTNVGKALYAVLAGSADVLQAAQAALTSAYNADQSTDAWATENAQLILGLQTSLNTIEQKIAAIGTASQASQDAQNAYSTVVQQGLAVQQQRLTFRQHSSAVLQGYATADFAFQAFQSEALERYLSLFDLAATYTYLAARAYDYETGLLDASGNSSAAAYYQSIVHARALGVITNGVPQFADNSMGGDPGLSAVLAQMAGDWSVVQSRLGFNNPDNYTTTFSLRQELYRILPGTEGNQAWQQQLAACQMADITSDPDVTRYCLQVADPNGLAVPGLVIPFQTTISPGVNFFGQPLAGGDHTYTSSSFSTKIRTSGIAFSGYIGMDAPSSTAGAVGSTGSTTPSSPDTGFSDPQSLSATPYVYLIPTGVDSMRSPPLGDSSTVRTWQVEDQAIPLPFNISGSNYSTQPSWVSASSLTEPMFAIRKHQAFRAVPPGTDFTGGIGFTNARLIGRSVWNSKWKLVIPGRTLLSDPSQGLQIFLQTVNDIQLYFQSYSYSGN